MVEVCWYLGLAGPGCAGWSWLAGCQDQVGCGGKWEVRVGTGIITQYSAASSRQYSPSRGLAASGPGVMVCHNTNRKGGWDKTDQGQRKRGSTDQTILSMHARLVHMDGVPITQFYSMYRA